MEVRFLVATIIKNELTGMRRMMFFNVFYRKASKQKATRPSQVAGELFERGMNCCQAVLQATTGRNDTDIMKMAKALGGGISDRKCLCGAITGGLMALGLSGKSHKSGKLIDQFREAQGATCCAALSRGHKWRSKAHLKNCQRITEETATTVAKML